MKEANDMEKGMNSNHPAKGSKINVSPIRTRKDRATLKSLLKDNPFDYALYVVGTATNLRAGDLLNLRIDQVKDMKPGDSLEIREGKTKKAKTLTLNKGACDAIQGLLAAKEYNDGDFLFTGQRGSVIGVPALNLKIKRWMKRINAKGNFGSHTLRKTWAYVQYKEFNVPLPLLMKALNHSSQAITLAYIGIQPKELQDIYMHEIV